MEMGQVKNIFLTGDGRVHLYHIMDYLLRLDPEAVDADIE